jgi:hypothetical protein
MSVISVMIVATSCRGRNLKMTLSHDASLTPTESRVSRQSSVVSRDARGKCVVRPSCWNRRGVATAGRGGGAQRGSDRSLGLGCPGTSWGCPFPAYSTSLREPLVTSSPRSENRRPPGLLRVRYPKRSHGRARRAASQVRIPRTPWRDRYGGRWFRFSKNG